MGTRQHRWVNREATYCCDQSGKCRVDVSTGPAALVPCYPTGLLPCCPPTAPCCQILPCLPACLSAPLPSLLLACCPPALLPRTSILLCLPPSGCPTPRANPITGGGGGEWVIACAYACVCMWVLIRFIVMCSTADFSCSAVYARPVPTMLESNCHPTAHHVAIHICSPHSPAIPVCDACATSPVAVHLQCGTCMMRDCKT